MNLVAEIPAIAIYTHGDVITSVLFEVPFEVPFSVPFDPAMAWPESRFMVATLVPLGGATVAQVRPFDPQDGSPVVVMGQ